MAQYGKYLDALKGEMGDESAREGGNKQKN